MSATPTARPFLAAARLVALAFVLLIVAGITLAWASPGETLRLNGANGTQDASEPAPQSSDDAAAQADDPSPNAHAAGAREEAGPFATPRSSLREFLQAVRADDAGSAAEHLDLSRVTAQPGSEEAETLARHLDIVIRRKIYVDLGLVSDDPAGDLEDGLAPDLERVGAIPSSVGEVPVRMKRDAAGAWRFDPYTVAHVPALYEEFGYGWIEEVLPRPLFDIRLLDLALWQWIGLLIVVVLASIVGYVAGLLVVGVVRIFVRRTSNEWDDWLLDGAGGPVRLVLSVVAFWLLSFLLALPVQAESFVAVVSKALSVVGVTWLLLRAIDVLARIVHDGMAGHNASAADTLVPMGRRFTKLAVIVVAGISLIHNLGFNAAGLLTGLGVGGLAVALAAQKTLENLFGGISVIADKPVEVGQFCKVGDHIGTVESIGLRSTRVRTLDRTVVTIPNAEFSTVRIENFAKRDRLRLHSILQVGYDTTPDQMRWLLAELRKLLHAHPKTLDDPCRVRFMNFGAHSLDLEVFVYIDTKDFNEFLKIKEDIFLRIIDVVEASGAYFAYPSQTLYMARDSGRDLEKSAAAEEAVKAWRADKKLPFPDFSSDTVKGFEGTLDYPPEGSETPNEPAAAS